MKKYPDMTFMNKEQRTKNKEQQTKKSFTLLEVMVSMAILTVLVLMVSNMFQDSSEAWNIGTQKAEVNTAGRAAVEFMARELSQAVAGPIDSAESTAAAYLPFRVVDYDDLRFLALSQEPSVSGSETKRALRGVYFWEEGNELKYARRTESLDCYTNIWNQGRNNPQHTLIENVQSLQFYVYTNEADMASGAYITPPEDLDRLPACVDISLVLLSRDDMVKAKSPGCDPNFINKNAKCYSTRVYFPNRRGYQKR